MSGQHLGFVGLGRMGGPMSGRLMDAGYTLTVFDTNEAAVKPLTDRGAERAGSPADIGRSLSGGAARAFARFAAS